MSTDKRLCDDKGNRGALHAKCAVADRVTLLVTSANLTEAALGRNMELGLQVKGGESAQKVWSCFDSLIRDGVLVKTKNRRPRPAGDVVADDPGERTARAAGARRG